MKILIAVLSVIWLASFAVGYSEALAQPKPAAPGASVWAYVGTYTGAKSKGIYLLKLDLASGALSPMGLAAETPSPSFLAIAPSGRFLYAVGEVSQFENKPSGSVTAFAIQPGTGKLTRLNQQPSAGAGPCHLVVDKSEHSVLVANYGGGSIAALPILDRGTLGPPAASIQHRGSSVNPQRQKEPHAHSINLDPANQFAFAADLGLDKVLIYRFDPSTSGLVAHAPEGVSVKPGAGPRHFTFHPKNNYAYVINELQSTVTAFSYDPTKGLLKEIQTISSLPKDSDGRGNSTAEVQVHPSGKFLYGSNRGHDSIAVFTIDPSTGTLTHVENEPTQGKTPRNFGIDPTGAFLLAANQDSDSIVVFRIDATTGALSPAGHTADVPTPVCVKFATPLAP